jgi:hypothetical protein
VADTRRRRRPQGTRARRRGGTYRAGDRMKASRRSHGAEWPVQRPLRPHFVAWVRFEPRASHDDGLVDAVRTLVLADALIWPAAVRSYGHQPTHAARSIDLAVSFTEPEAMTPWLLCETTRPWRAIGACLGDFASVVTAGTAGGGGAEQHVLHLPHRGEQ